jgi:hypothetical protein
VREDVAQLGFGELDDKQVERSAMAVAGLQPSGTLDKGLGQDVDVQLLFSRVSKALVRAVEFLVDDAGIPHISWMPYSGALTSLARLFDLHPDLHPRNRVLLVRWFWRGMLTGDHRTDNRTDGPKWRAIDTDEHATLQRLLKLLPQVTVDDVPRELSTAATQSAQRKMELVALASLDPCVLTRDERGRPVPIAALIDGLADFPTILTTEGKKTLATLLLHSRLKIEALVASAPPQQLLDTHGIDAEAFAALAADEIDVFLKRRTERLSEHLHTFLVSQAGLDAADHDRLPLDSYFEESA